MHRSLFILSAIVGISVITFAANAAPHPADAGAFSSPLRDTQRMVKRHGVSYSISDHFIIAARNVKTHRLIWKTHYVPTASFYSSPVTASPDELSLTLYHSTLYASDRFGLTAIEAATGRKIWTVNYPNDIDGQPTIQEGVIVASYESSGAISTGAIQALDAGTGRFMWRALGVAGYKYSERRRGFLIYRVDQFMGSTGKGNETGLINIHTGRQTLTNKHEP